MKKRICLLLVLVVVGILFSGCSDKPYRSSEVLGLSSMEIEAMYGPFDLAEEPDPDGLYRNQTCAYLAREKKVGFLGTTPPEYFYIHFDYLGIAISCEYRERV